jgi:cell division protein FtsW
MVYSSSAFMSSEMYGNSFHYLIKHLFTVIIGLFAMIFLSNVDYIRLKPYIIPLLMLSGILLLLVFVPGIGVSAGPKSEVKRWIRLWPSTFQPSELVKLAMVLFLADYMSRNAVRLKEFYSGVIIPIGVMMIFQLMILFQPDFGAAISLGVITFTLLFIGGIRLKYLIGIISLSLPAFCLLIYLTPYRMRRISAFLDPWSDPQNSGFQLIQSFLAFGRGGLAGVGLGSSRQKLFFLPEAHTDFIFSLIGEEAGLIGVVVVLLLFIWLFIKGFKIAMKAGDSFGYYLATGISIMIGSQALINFAVSTGVLPTKGLPLPFISYGGSSLLVNMVAVGILMSISKQSSVLANVRTSDIMLDFYSRTHSPLMYEGSGTQKGYLRTQSVKNAVNRSMSAGHRHYT